MERKGYVSLWIGNISTEEELTNYVELIYTEEGDFLPSPFLKDFNIDIDDFDEDFLEKVLHEEEKEKVSELIAGCSYENVVIPLFQKSYGATLPDNINSAILLYDFYYDGEIKQTLNKEPNFIFVGSVSYDV